jgi:hypothetical protein
MSFSATGWNTLDPKLAYTQEMRAATMRKAVRQAFDGGWIGNIKCSLFAATYDVPRTDVQDEIKKYNELAGGGK